MTEWGPDRTLREKSIFKILPTERMTKRRRSGRSIANVINRICGAISSVLIVSDKTSRIWYREFQCLPGLCVMASFW